MRFDLIRIQSDICVCMYVCVCGCVCVYVQGEALFQNITPSSLFICIHILLRELNVLLQLSCSFT